VAPAAALASALAGKAAVRLAAPAPDLALLPEPVPDALALPPMAAGWWPSGRATAARTAPLAPLLRQGEADLVHLFASEAGPVEQAIIGLCAASGVPSVMGPLLPHRPGALAALTARMAPAPSWPDVLIAGSHAALANLPPDRAATAIWLPRAAITPAKLPEATMPDGPALALGWPSANGAVPAVLRALSDEGRFALVPLGPGAPLRADSTALLIPVIDGDGPVTLAVMAQGHVPLVPEGSEAADLVTSDTGHRWSGPLAEAVLAALAHPGRLADQAAAGRARARAHHSFAARARQWAEVYAHALGRRAAAPLFFSAEHPILSTGFGAAEEDGRAA
jgi:hypothetical protein